MITLYNENDVQIRDIRIYEINDADMGESTITATVKFDQVMQFHPDWYVLLNGEKYKLGITEPSGKRSTTSINVEYTLTFHSSREDLKRYTFMDFVEYGSGNPQPSQHTFSLQACTLGQLVNRFNINLQYYLGSLWTMELSDDADPSIVADLSFDKASLWDVLLNFHKDYGVRWTIHSNDGVMTILVGEDATELQTIFEYGKGNGLISVERTNPTERIVTRLRGKGSEKNLPANYFHAATSAFPIADPDTNSVLQGVFYNRLYPKCYRDYVRGYNSGQSQTGSSWAYQQGVADKVAGKSMNIVDFAKSDNEDLWGISYGAVEDNDEIFPTLQGATREGVELDKVLAISPIYVDAPDDGEAARQFTQVNGAKGSFQGRDTHITYNGRDGGISSVVGISNAKLATADSATFTLETAINTIRAKFLVTSTKFADFYANAVGITGPKSPILTTVSAMAANNWNFVERLQLINATTNVVVRTWNGNNQDFFDVVADDIPAGTYKFRSYIQWYKTTGTTQDKLLYTIDWQLYGCEYASYQNASSKKTFSETFDIWIGNVWNTTPYENESDEAYACRVWAPLVSKEEMTVMFSDGLLAGEDYEFPIVGLVNGSDNLAEIIKKAIHYDTSVTGSHWRLTLRKSDAEFEASGKYLPNSVINVLPGNHFFFINIQMPYDPYIYDAERRQQEYLEDQLSLLDVEQPTFAVVPSSVFMASLDEVDDVVPGNKIRLRDVSLIGSSYTTAYIQSISKRYTKNKINPDWSLVVSDQIIVNGNPITLIEGKVEALSRQMYSSKQATRDAIEAFAQFYLRKDGLPDASFSATDFRAPVTFRDRITDYNFRQGDFGGYGFGVYTDPDGNRVVEADVLVGRMALRVNELVVNQVEYVGGQKIYSAAAMTISKVESTATVWRCYFDNKQGTVRNMFLAGDLAFCQRFKGVEEGGLTTYWAKVTAIGSDYIEISKTDTMVSGSGSPAVGDNIIQLGNASDQDRQSAIIMSSYGANSPSIRLYHGISGYTLANKDVFGVEYDSTNHIPYFYNYGSMRLGARETEADGQFISYNHLTGTLNIRATVNFIGGSSGLTNLAEWNEASQRISDAWQDALDAQRAADAAQDTANEALRTIQSYIDQVNNDSIFDLTEKNLIRKEWIAINGIESTMRTGRRGSYYLTKHNFENNIFTGDRTVFVYDGVEYTHNNIKYFYKVVGMTQLDATYKELRSYLNEVQLNDRGRVFVGFDREKLADLLTNYYDAEQRIRDIVAQNLDAKIDNTKTELQNALADYQSAVNAAISNIQDQIDGVIDTWFYEYDPTTSNAPASDWTTEELKKEHIGDLFYNNATGKAFRWIKDSSTNEYRWQELSDDATARALALAQEAKDTADGKRRVFYRQPLDSESYDPGDLWVDATYGTTYSNDILRCRTGKASGVVFRIADWVRASKYTDDTVALDARQKANAAQTAADNAAQAAQAAATAASNAQTVANNANTQLMNWANDSLISPTEKEALRQQWKDVQTEKVEVCAEAYEYRDWITDYQSKVDAYVSAYDLANTAFAKYTATTPENITIESDYADIAAYYDARVLMADIVAKAAKDRADEAAADAADAWEAARNAQQTADDAKDSANRAIDALAKLDDDSILTVKEKVVVRREWVAINGVESTTHGSQRGTYYQTLVNLRGVEGKGDIIFTYRGRVYSYDGVGFTYGHTGEARLTAAYIELRSYLAEIELNDRSSSYNDFDHDRLTALFGAYYDAEAIANNRKVSAVADFIETDYKEDMEKVKEQVDGKAETWVQSSDPSTAWLTDEDKNLHVGDLWLNTTLDDNGNTHTYVYRKNGNNYRWEEMNGVPEDVFDIFDGKACIFITLPASNVATGDLLIPNYNFTYSGKTYHAGRVYKWNGSSWVEVDYVDTDTFNDAMEAIMEVLDGFASDGEIDESEKRTLSMVLADETQNRLDLVARATPYVSTLAVNVALSNFNKAFSAPSGFTGFPGMKEVIEYYISRTGNVAISNSYPLSKITTFYEKRNILIQAIDTAEKTLIDSKDNTQTTIDGGLITTGTIQLRDTENKVMVGMTAANRTNTKESHIGDVWKSNASSTDTYIYRKYNGTYSWLSTLNSSEIFNATTGKRNIYVNKPESYKEGDYWFLDTSYYIDGETISSGTVVRATQDSEVWSIAHWVKETSSDVLNFLHGPFNSYKSAVSEQVDGKAEIWLQPANPALEWDDDESEDAQDVAVRIWAGETFENRENAPFRVLQNGEFWASKGYISEGVHIGELKVESGGITHTSGLKITPQGCVFPNATIYGSLTAKMKDYSNKAFVRLEDSHSAPVIELLGTSLSTTSQPAYFGLDHGEQLVSISENTSWTTLHINAGYNIFDEHYITKAGTLEVPSFKLYYNAKNVHDALTVTVYLRITPMGGSTQETTYFTKTNQTDGTLTWTVPTKTMAVSAYSSIQICIKVEGSIRCPLWGTSYVKISTDASAYAVVNYAQSSSVQNKGVFIGRNGISAIMGDYMKFQFITGDSTYGSYWGSDNRSDYGTFEVSLKGRTNTPIGIRILGYYDANGTLDVNEGGIYINMGKGGGWKHLVCSNMTAGTGTLSLE